MHTLRLGQLPVLKLLIAVLFFLLFITPFLIFHSINHLPNFFTSINSLMLVLSIVFFTIFTHNFKIILKPIVFYFFIIAVYWLFQSKILLLPYPQDNLIVSYVFFSLILLAIALQQLIKQYGIHTLINIMAVALIIGAILQSIIMWCQFFNIQHAWVFKMGSHYVVGNMGQRNNLGHYLFWGICSAIYLSANHTLPKKFALILIAYLALIQGLVPSRTIFLYIATLSLFAIIAYSKASSRTLAKICLFAMLLCLVCQFLTVPSLQFLFNIDAESGGTRVLGGSFSDRMYEWLKALIIFTDAPLWGHGWGSYTHHSIIYDTMPEMDNRPRFVFFTHSHNIILQLLAEMGIAGTLIIVMGFIFIIIPKIKQFFKLDVFYLLSLISISLIHSLLEYPLWYIEFLVPFAVFLILLNSNSKYEFCFTSTFNSRIIGLVFSIILAYSLFSYYGYAKYLTVYADISNKTKEEGLIQSNKLVNLGKQVSFIQNPADFLAVSILPTEYPTPEWIIEPLNKQTDAYPHPSILVKQIKYLIEIGQIDLAKVYLEKLIHHSPYMLETFYHTFNKTPELNSLSATIIELCVAKKGRLKEIKSCQFTEQPLNSQHKPRDLEH